MKPGADLSPLSVAILGLLHENPMHPYEISQTMRARHMDYCIKLKFGSLYHTIEALARDGLIVPVETAREGRRPERTVYGLTVAGRAAFTARLSDMLAEPNREYTDFAAGLKFIFHLDQPAALALLEERVAALEVELGRNREVLAMLEAKGLYRLSYIELDHSEAALAAELAWVRRVQEEIDDGKLEWRAGMKTAVTTGDMR